MKDWFNKIANKLKYIKDNINNNYKKTNLYYQLIDKFNTNAYQD